MDKKNQKNLTGCFFLCTSNKKKKIIDNKLDQIETIPNKNPAEKINSSLSIIPKIKEKDSYGNSPGELNNIDENPSTKNLNSSKLLKNTSKIDISNKDLTKSLEDEKKENNNEIDKKLESSLNYKEIPIQKIEKTIKNTSPQVIDGNIKLNNSHLKDSKEIIYQNKPDDSEISKSNRTSNSKINNDLKKSIVEMNKDTNKNDEKNEINIKNNKFNQKENPSMIDIKLESDSYKVNIIPLTKDNKIEDNQQINVLEHHDSNKEEEIDEFKDYKNESDNESICQKSVISSNILSHIKKTKSYLNQKYENVSTYSRSDTSMIINNDLDFQCQQSSSIKNYCNYLKTSTELSEFEVFNDNDRIHRYIETPKSSTVTNVITYLKQSNSKSLIEILQKKDKSIKHLNQKILKSKRSLDNFVEENKKLCTKIEKEEAEGERLRHVLNYLLSHRD